MKLPYPSDVYCLLMNSWPFLALDQIYSSQIDLPWSYLWVQPTISISVWFVGVGHYSITNLTSSQRPLLLSAYQLSQNINLETHINYYSFFFFLNHFQVPDELLQEAKAAAKAALEEMDADQQIITIVNFCFLFKWLHLKLIRSFENIHKIFYGVDWSFFFFFFLLDIDLYCRYGIADKCLIFLSFDNSKLSFTVFDRTLLASLIVSNIHLTCFCFTVNY